MLGRDVLARTCKARLATQLCRHRRLASYRTCDRRIDQAALELPLSRTPTRAMSAKSSSVTQTISVAVIGVGLVGAEFVRQLLSLAQPHPFRLVSLSSSKTHIFAPDGLQLGIDDWQAALKGSSARPDVPALVRELAELVTPGRRVVLVDNTASDAIAAFYPEFLRVGT
jgi:hypothetical protein